MRKKKPRSRMGLVSIYTAQGLLEAQVIKTKLETLDIPCVLEYESSGQVLGLTVDGMGAVHVMVPAHLADESRKIVQPFTGPPEEDQAPGEPEPDTGEPHGERPA